MVEPVIVSIAALRTALSRALDATEARLGAEVVLDADTYWHLPVLEAFNMASEPQTFTVGQVSDDLADSVLDDHDRSADEAWHDLSHLVGILRALELAAHG